MEAQPFRINVADSVLQDLRERIARTRWPDTIADSGWSYGTDIGTLQQLVRYWQQDFDWRKEEDRINTFPQYLLTIEGLQVHFVHIRSANPHAVPIILNHGWPGSFLELLKVASLLRNSFHVVIPSLPGYGFSEGSRKPGLNPRKIARMWAQLMHTLGYNKFVSHGGDWGATISTWLALDAPDSVIGIHLNYIPGSYLPNKEEGERLSLEEEEFFRSREEWEETEGGYAHLHKTKPQTIAYALNDSPVGLAAWILEKSHGWSHCEGDVLKYFTYEELLSNIMLYWTTGSIGSSMRLYYEARNSPLQLAPGQRIHVPTAVARFAKEEPMPPRRWVERGYNLCRWTEYPAGSHFASVEFPDLLARDIIDSLVFFV